MHTVAVTEVAVTEVAVTAMQHLRYSATLQVGCQAAGQGRFT